MSDTKQVLTRPSKSTDVFTARGVRNPVILEAMRSIPRQAFPTNEGTPPPDALGRIIEALDLQPSDRVLVIGVETGWAAAVLGCLAADVLVVEPDPRSAEAARDRIAKHARGKIAVIVGDGGSPEVAAKAPFDVITLARPVPEVPSNLVELLAPRGRLVTVVCAQDGRRRLKRVRVRADGAQAADDLGESRAVPLLGDLLTANTRVTRATIEDAAASARKRGVSLGDELLARGLCEESDLYRALAKQNDLPFATAADILTEIDPGFVGRYPRKFLDHHRAIPVREQDGEILVATASPSIAIWELAQAFETRRISVRVVTPTDHRRIWTAIDLGHVNQPRTEEEPADNAQAEEFTDQTPGEATRASATLDAILLDAVTERSSDLHLERYEGKVRVRFRVDGNLRDVDRYGLSTHDLSALVNIIKISAKLDIAERRLPQGGRMRKRFGDRIYDMRVQTQPALHGEHIVIRLIPQENRVPVIEELGFPEDLANRYRRILRSPHGLLLVVGPTGSGKSTTLYAGLHLLSNDVSRKIITVEDPIENAIPRIQQTQANGAIGWGFADAMRAFVREDPDVILIGEIRDAETAIEAIRASQTGHLVLSTLHCNDAVDAVQRLLDLGMHPNSIGSELSAIVSQRLARRICKSCRAPAAPDPGIAADLFPSGIPAGFTCFAGKGCEQCGGHGTRGRIAVVEFLQVSAAIRRAISRREAIDELRSLARDSGLFSLRDSCLRLVRDGEIPMTEIVDVLTPEQMNGGAVQPCA